ncbi:hypothetical protein V6Z11_A12G272300 [Gossypium hirsutum]
MARLAISFIVIFVLFTISHARFIVPDQAVTSEEIVAGLPESDSTTTNVILLPNEISFRPVKGHFPRHPLIPFRNGHDCRYHRRFRPLNSRFQRKRYVSYGNGMALSDERSRSDPESIRLGNQMRGRGTRFPDNGAESKEHVDFRKVRPYNHEHEQDHDNNDHHPHHHYQHHRRHHRQGEEDERRESEEKDGGFIKRFRKFLINF